jgi:hypothetical protein
VAAKRLSPAANGIHSNCLVVLEAELEAYGDRVAVTFRATHTLRDSEKGAVGFRIAPDARFPRVAIDRSTNRGASPGVGDRWHEFVGDRREMPSARSGIPKEPRYKGAAVRLGHEEESDSRLTPDKTQAGEQQ